jgi:hypothetical protein
VPVAGQGEEPGDVGDEVAAGGRLLDLRGQRAQLVEDLGRHARRRDPHTVGTSIRRRSSLRSSRSFSDSSVTRKPLLRTISTSPSPARSSMASRTGVADTPNWPARLGAA